MSVDDKRSGWPLTVICVEVREQFEQRKWDNRKIDIEETASEVRTDAERRGQWLEF
jgi:hypothetical protein